MKDRVKVWAVEASFTGQDMYLPWKKHLDVLKLLNEAYQMCEHFKDQVQKVPPNIIYANERTCKSTCKADMRITELQKNDTHRVKSWEAPAETDDHVTERDV